MDYASAAATVFAAANFAAAFAVLAGLFVGVGQGNIAAKAIESMARQPEARGNINTAMIIGMAMAETSAIYGLVIALLLLFANPLTSAFLDYLGTIGG